MQKISAAETLSGTMDEYLETIHWLASIGVVRPTRIAESMGVSAATVTATLKRLEALEMITRKGTEVALTEVGRVLSIELLRHRITERFLAEVLRLDWEDAHTDARLLEHAISPRVLDALERFVGEPTTCPLDRLDCSTDVSTETVVGKPYWPRQAR